MILRLYDVPTGSTPLWTEQWAGSNSVRVSNGLFNVMLGSLNAIRQQDIANHDQLWLGITVGTDDEMRPRVQLGSVPFAVQALTVPDGSVTTAKIADGAVTAPKLNLLEGTVGIGTVNPKNKLEVNGVIAGGSMNLDLLGTPLAGYLDTIGWGLLIGQNRSRGARETDFINFGGLGPGAGDGGFRFYIADRSDTDPVLTIDNNGNVGIGTTSPGAKLEVNGNFHATGTKSAVVQAGEFGQRKLYAAESPEVRFFDEGLARLRNGVAQVELDPVFLETIEGDYLVHVTPYGNASLYVAEIGKDYFVVKARDGDPNVAFAWRLSATRKGYAGVRLEEIE